MALEQLEPDALELRIGAHTGILLPCPFCGKHPFLFSSVNEVLRGGEPMAIYQGKVSCGNHHCFASVIQNERTREQAQQSAMAQWNRRVPATA